jgi:cytochrome P450
LINASLDATAAALSWTLCLVAAFPDVQARVRQEIEGAASLHNESAASTAELPCAEMVVHESLRLYPPNWVLITRHCVRDTTLGEYRIPAESSLYIFPYVVHRAARWFAAPEDFDPDRFAQEKLGRAQRSAYIPLGLGPHVCIGKALSTILLTSMLACVLQEFRLSVSPGYLPLVPDVGLVLRPRSDIHLEVTHV